MKNSQKKYQSRLATLDLRRENMKTKSALRLVAMAALIAMFSLAFAIDKKPEQNAPTDKPNVAHLQTAVAQAPQTIVQSKKGSITALSLDKLEAKRITTKDGKSGWAITIPGNRPMATPAVVDGMVYVGGGFGSNEFYAFDADTGKAAWGIRVNDDGPTAAVVASGVVAFNTESCTLFVTDARTGRMLWSKWLGDPLMSQPAIADGKIFMAFPASGSHQLAAMDLKSGKDLWHADIAGDIISAPVVYEDSVYLTTFDGTVYRYGMNDGAQIWKKDLHATSAPWLYKDQVFVSQRKEGDDKKPVEGISRLEKSKGTNNQAGGIWRAKSAPYLDARVQKKSEYAVVKKAQDSSVGFANAPASAKVAAAEVNVGQSSVNGLWEYQGSRPCVFRQKLFLTQGDQVVALDPDSGKELWSKNLSGDLEKIGGHLAAPPSPAGDKLYLATATGDILVLSQGKGLVLDNIKVGSPMRFQPSIARGKLFIGTSDGQLIGLDLNDKTADGWTMWGGGPTHNGNQ